MVWRGPRVKTHGGGWSGEAIADWGNHPHERTANGYFRAESTCRSASREHHGVESGLGTYCYCSRHPTFAHSPSVQHRVVNLDQCHRIDYLHCLLLQYSTSGWRESTELLALANAIGGMKSRQQVMHNASRQRHTTIGRRTCSSDEGPRTRTRTKGEQF